MSALPHNTIAGFEFPAGSLVPAHSLQDCHVTSFFPSLAPTTHVHVLMRLLKQGETGEFSVTADLVGEDATPPYAILSHRWGEDAEEVTFEDVAKNAGKNKSGYKKIQFCGEQAKRDGLQYFWIDTCCINKTNKAEHSLAIQSMFRWYRNADRCYVYLSDVYVLALGRKGEVGLPLRDLGFQRSEWFTRGWTLQELLAPSSVEFFSHEWAKLGDKISLTQTIHEITGIPPSALRGAPLSEFSVNERLRWKEGRVTKREEDGAYSLLGIFDVELAPLYGEGAAGAFRRLVDEIYKLERCVKDIRSTDPRDDKKRIQETNGGLLQGSYRWVLNNNTFQQWQQHQHSPLLWVKGDPGKGKTMLLCGIVDELHSLMPKTALLAYFFCQATDSRINSATAVLRGLLYMLVNQQLSLASHVRKRYDHAGKALFEDANAWIVLTEIFTNVIQDPNLQTTYLIVDALDECIIDLPKLLDFVATTSSAHSRAKWIVSSRNWPDIEDKLKLADYKASISLELNADSISMAVKHFIEQKVSQLAQKKKYDEQTRCAVLSHLVSNANNTFLWVALVCQSLEQTSKRNTLKRLNAFPPQLDSLYEQMMQQISDSDDAELYKHVLATTVVVYRPISLEELVVLVEQLEDITHDLDSIQEVVSSCGSFLTLRKGIVYLVHQSVRDFLLAKAAKVVFPFGLADVHHAIFTRSLEIMFKTLHRDMYNLKAPGYSIENVKQPDSDPLAASRYSCIYWIDHLCTLNLDSSLSCVVSLQEGGVVDEFFKKKYLNWLEALSLCKSVSNGIVSMSRLETLLQETIGADSLSRLIQDAARLITYYKWEIGQYPLQVYASTMVFSPTSSSITALFNKEAPDEVRIRPAVGTSWSACLQTLEGHSDTVMSVAFSHDLTQLASASRDKTIKIWDLSNGECLKTLQGHSDSVNSIAFSHNSAQLASASSDSSIKIWDVSSISCLRTLKSHLDSVISVVFSHNSTWLASGSGDGTIKIWDASSGACLQTLKGHVGSVQSVAFSHHSTCLASAASMDKRVRIWCLSSGTCMQILKVPEISTPSVAFSHDSIQLAISTGGNIVSIWNLSGDEPIQTQEMCQGRTIWVKSLAFSHNSTRLASATLNGTVEIWEVSSGECLHTLKGHTHSIESVAFSHDSTRLASASADDTIKIWDVSSRKSKQANEDHNGRVWSVIFSPDLTRLVSWSMDCTVKIWNVSSGECLQTLDVSPSWPTTIVFSHDSKQLAILMEATVKILDVSTGDFSQILESHTGSVTSVAFSHDSKRLASASRDNTARIWDVGSGICLQTMEGHSSLVTCIAFTHDSTQLVSASGDGTIKMWNTSSGTCLQTLKGHSDSVDLVRFSHDSKQLASISVDRTIRLWDTDIGECLQTLEGHDGDVSLVAFSHDTRRLASASFDKTVKIWDTSSGECLQTLYTGKGQSQLSFDPTGSWLHTEVGSIMLSLRQSSDTPTLTEPQQPQYKDGAISEDGMWVMYNGEKLLRLPSEYRPSCSAVSENMIGIGAASGKVWVCSFLPSKPEASGRTVCVEVCECI